MPPFSPPKLVSSWAKAHVQVYIHSMQTTKRSHRGGEAVYSSWFLPAQTVNTWAEGVVCSGRLMAGKLLVIVPDAH